METEISPELIIEQSKPLILDTYTEVFSADDAEYETAQLARIK